MVSRKTKRKFTSLLYAIAVVSEIVGVIAVVFFRRSDLPLIRFNTTIRVCLTIGVMLFIANVIYAGMKHWVWYLDIFPAWQMLRLAVFAGSLVLAQRDERYEYVDGRKWR